MNWSEEKSFLKKNQIQLFNPQYVVYSMMTDHTTQISFRNDQVYAFHGKE